MKKNTQIHLRHLEMPVFIIHFRPEAAAVVPAPCFFRREFARDRGRLPCLVQLWPRTSPGRDRGCGRSVSPVVRLVRKSVGLAHAVWRTTGADGKHGHQLVICHQVNYGVRRRSLFRFTKAKPKNSCGARRSAFAGASCCGRRSGGSKEAPGVLRIEI